MPCLSTSQGYGPVASCYALLAQLYSGGAIGCCHRWAVEQIPAGARALFVGPGPGGDVEQAARAGVQVTAIDRCAAMVQASRRRLQRSGLTQHVSLHHGDVRDLPVTADYDVVVAQFVLNVFDQETLPHVVRALTSHLRPQGVLLVGDFAQPSSGLQAAYHDLPMHLFSRLGVNAVHPAHDLLTVLSGAGLVLKQRRCFRLFGCGPAWVEGLMARRPSAA